MCVLSFLQCIFCCYVFDEREKSLSLLVIDSRFEMRTRSLSTCPLPSFRHKTQLHLKNQSNNQHGNVNPPYADRCMTLTSHSSIFWCFLSCPILPRLPHSIALATCCQSNILFLLYHEFFKLCNNNKTLGKTSIILTKIKINQEGITCSSNAC